jgi:hypothetical protein
MKLFDQVAKRFRPAGIRNGGLLLVLVALAAVMALVDRPPEPGVGGRLGGGISQHLPPPAGITAVPPVAAEPPVPPAGERLGALGDAGERPAASARAHPRRQHPRPLSRRASSGPRDQGAPEREGSPTPGSGDPVVHNPPPVAATPAARVRVPPVAVRVTPPAVLGRSLPEVEVATAEVSATLDEGPRLLLR